MKSFRLGTSELLLPPEKEDPESFLEKLRENEAPRGRGAGRRPQGERREESAGGDAEERRPSAKRQQRLGILMEESDVREDAIAVAGRARERERERERGEQGGLWRPCGEQRDEKSCRGSKVNLGKKIYSILSRSKRTTPKKEKPRRKTMKMDRWRASARRLFNLSSHPDSAPRFAANPARRGIVASGSLHCSGGSCRGAQCCFGHKQPLCVHLQEREIALGASLIQSRCFGSMATKIQRNPKFATINSDDIRYFRELLGEKNVVQDEDTLLAANMDWMRKYKGSSKLLLLPRSTKEVSQILKYCNSRCLGVVPQGGNTGLVGGSVPVFDEVIVNLGSMNKVISFDEVSGILVSEAGCILESLVNFLDNKGFIMPLDLGAKGSCQIGGNVSTNAGGLRLLRYGSLHANVLGLEAVLANGDVLDMLGILRKDNTGYDLKHLFIGSEGSLGIVTKVSILTPPKLSSVNVAFLACTDYLSCQKLLLEAKRKLGEILSAFEFLDEQAMDIALNHLEGVRNPLPPVLHKFYVLIETTGSDERSDKEKLEAFLVHSMEGGLISDGVVAQDIQQASSVWNIREGIPEALMKAGAVYKYDLSIPVEKIYDIVEEMRNKLGHLARVVAYGHLGDGNLHLNISCPQYDDAVLAQIEPFVYEWTSKIRGSISAEHGLGLMKANKIFYSKSPAAVQLMGSVKNLLDPNHILNPYKVLPQSLSSP